jgi:hypothetical protein
LGTRGRPRSHLWGTPPRLAHGQAGASATSPSRCTRPAHREAQSCRSPFPRAADGPLSAARRRRRRRRGRSPGSGCRPACCA